MEKELFQEVQDTEDALRRLAAEALEAAKLKRNEAIVLEGKANGLTQAANMLRNIERPQ